ncbi:hypothetical protein QS259_25290, partial [Escherichia coli]|nr:hypothetical protein [Escherichia coli]
VISQDNYLSKDPASGAASRRPPSVSYYSRNQNKVFMGCRGEALTQSRSASGVYTGLLRYKPRQP